LGISGWQGSVAGHCRRPARRRDRQEAEAEAALRAALPATRAQDIHPKGGTTGK